MCDFQKGTFSPQNNFDQMFTFNHSSFHHFVQYLRSSIITLTGYQMSLTSCTKLGNGKRLKVSLGSKLFVGTFLPFQKLGHTLYINININK